MGVRDREPAGVHRNRSLADCARPSTEQAEAKHASSPHSSILLVLASCGVSSPEAERPALGPAAAPQAERISGTSRCLPVVSVECGCVYDRGGGKPPDANGVSASTARSGLKPSPCECSSGASTASASKRSLQSMFAVPGQGHTRGNLICAPKPADPTGAFRQERCESALSDPGESAVVFQSPRWSSRFVSLSNTVVLPLGRRPRCQGSARPPHRRRTRPESH